jgi:hypothetical protein
MTQKFLHKRLVWNLYNGGKHGEKLEIGRLNVFSGIVAGGRKLCLEGYAGRGKPGQK